MDTRVRVVLIVCFCAFVASFVIQTVFQKIVAGDMSTWGFAPGWQREIAFWNVGCAIVAIGSLRLKSTHDALPVVLGFTALFLLLGINHAFALFQDPASNFHWPPFVANLVGLFFGVKTLVQSWAKGNSSPSSANKEAARTKKTIDALIKQTQSLFAKVGDSINTINQSPFLPDNKETIATENIKIKQWRQEIANSIAKIDPMFEAAVELLPVDDLWLPKTKDALEELKRGQAAFM
jgi:hypothetical protein